MRAQVGVLDVTLVQSKSCAISPALFFKFVNMACGQNVMNCGVETGRLYSNLIWKLTLVRGLQLLNKRPFGANVFPAASRPEIWQVLLVLFKPVALSHQHVESEVLKLLLALVTVSAFSVGAGVSAAPLGPLKVFE